MRCAGAVGADQDLPVKRLLVELRKREIQHGLVVGGGVRAGVPRPQDPCGRLAGPVEIAQQRMMAVAALEVPGRVLLLRAGARERRVDVDHRPLRTVVPSRARALRPRPELPRPARPSATAARNLPKHSSSIEAITRNAVEPDATLPYRSGWSRDAPRSAKQSPPSASITARSRSTTPGSCAERRSRDGAIAAH